MPCGNTIAEGTTISSLIKVKGFRNVIHWTVTDYDEPRLIALSGTGRGGVNIDLAMKVDEIADGSHFDLSAELSDEAIEPRAARAVEIETKYAGYLRRQEATIRQQQKVEHVAIAATFNYDAVPQLRIEAREKFGRVRPANLGQAGRISGITPADLALLMVHLEQPAVVESD